MQLTKSIVGKMYSFNGRYLSKDLAKESASKMNTNNKHSYYSRVIERGVMYYDVRTEN